ncbi:MAG: hypothetical protein HY074_04165 [Deltaproteobacteria bacterium]|nr:hypothetical protein [Deltaproteobacteria bacterium]
MKYYISLALIFILMASTIVHSDQKKKGVKLPADDFWRTVGDHKLDLAVSEAEAGSAVDDIVSPGVGLTSILASEFLLGGNGIKQSNTGKSDNNPLGARYLYPVNEKLHIDPAFLGLCMAQASISTGHYYFAKDEMQYETSTHEIRKDKMTGAPLLLYLAGESGRSGDYISGHEEELKTWILSQPDNSIDPVTIYQKSLGLNEGNIWNALLTIHQLLRNNARWWASSRYFYSSSKENQEAFFNKFIDIRGDLTDRGSGFSGDHYGSWYRLWGIMLYRISEIDDALAIKRFAAAHNCENSKAMTGLEDFGLQVGDLKARGAAIYNELVKRITFVDSDGGKLQLDLAGLNAINWMMLGLWYPRLLKDYFPSESACRARRYLYDADGVTRGSDLWRWRMSLSRTRHGLQHMDALGLFESPRNR